jgi:hypothetical protein
MLPVADLAALAEVRPAHRAPRTEVAERGDVAHSTVEHVTGPPVRLSQPGGASCRQRIVAAGRANCARSPARRTGPVSASAQDGLRDQGRHLS